MRVEKQIYAGRQEVRRAMKGKSKGVHERRSLLLPPQSISTAASLQSNVSQSTATGSDRPERPLSVDTDAESAFSHGSRWFYRRGRNSPSPAHDPADPLLSPSIRRKWASGLLDVPPNSDHRSAKHEEKSDDHDMPEGRSTTPHSSFFARLRQNSLASLSLPFSQSKKGSEAEHADRDMSVDSSSDEDSESFWPQEYVNEASLRGMTREPEEMGEEHGFGQDSSSEDI